MILWPYGEFLEIEGPGKNIRHEFSLLRLSWGNRILINYLAIFDLIKKQARLPFDHVTFEHFQHYTIDI
ncbi:MAG: hypothetical protein GY874_05125 [Desulfobacteraceae bacterium]|nr:hypothetical protein [Desulfobacteraceae bacterium]